MPFALLGAGFSLEEFGSTPTVLILSSLMIAVAVASVSSRAIRQAPPHLADDAVAK